MEQLINEFATCIKDTLSLEDEDASQPLERFDNAKGDYNLNNPYSKCTCLILYLFSMELGDPPLYSEVRRSIRTVDRGSLETLGPFARALDRILSAAESHRQDSDRIPGGHQF